MLRFWTKTILLLLLCSALICRRHRWQASGLDYWGRHGIIEFEARIRALVERGTRKKSTWPRNARTVEVAEAAWERLAEILSIFGPLAAGPMPRLQAERRR